MVFETAMFVVRAAKDREQRLDGLGFSPPVPTISSPARVGRHGRCALENHWAYMQAPLATRLHPAPGWVAKSKQHLVAQTRPMRLGPSGLGPERGGGKNGFASAKFRPQGSPPASTRPNDAAGTNAARETLQPDDRGVRARHPSQRSSGNNSEGGARRRSFLWRTAIGLAAKPVPAESLSSAQVTAGGNRCTTTGPAYPAISPRICSVTVLFAFPSCAWCGTGKKTMTPRMIPAGSPPGRKKMA